jgi:hypothetical protein
MLSSILETHEKKPPLIILNGRARVPRMHQTRMQNRNKKVWRSAAAKRLLKLAGEARTVEDAIQRLTQRYLEGVNCPPTDLDPIGAKLGITGFEAADLAGSGELRRDGEGLRIFYSHHLSAERRRFTIAHEMCHAALERAGRHVPRYGKELERLCDMFAAELLMPRQLFIESALGEVSTQRILDLARHFRTSVATTGIRYAELRRVSVFACQDLRVIWGRGILRPSQRTPIDKSLRPSICKALDGEPSSDEVFLTAGPPLCRWYFECRPLAGGRSVLCLLRPVEE